jgi:hypothetical protein
VVFYNRHIVTDLGSLQIGLLLVDPLSRCLGSEQFKAPVLIGCDTELLGPVPYLMDSKHIDPVAIRAASLGLVIPLRSPAASKKTSCPRLRPSLCIEAWSTVCKIGHRGVEIVAGVTVLIAVKATVLLTHPSMLA